MGKKASNSVLDNGPQHVKDNATTLILLDAEPADRAAAIANALVSISVVTGDFTIADGTPNGRTLTVAAKSGTASASGSHNHTAIISGTELLLVTTSDATKSINNGDTVNSGSFTYRFADPT